MKRSPYFRALRQRLAGPPPHLPSEVWTEQDQAHFVFDLEVTTAGGAFPPAALFIVDTRTGEILLARVIVPSSELTEVQITDMYRRP